MYLNEDEQLSIFTIINAELFYLYQEFVFLGCYQKMKDLEEM